MIFNTEEIFSVTIEVPHQASSQPSDKGGGDPFPQILELFRVWKLGVHSGCLSRRNLNFQNNNDWWRYFVVRARIFMLSLVNFINSISQTDDIQDVSIRTGGGKWPFSTEQGVVRPLLLPLAMGLHLHKVTTRLQKKTQIQPRLLIPHHKFLWLYAMLMSICLSVCQFVSLSLVFVCLSPWPWPSPRVRRYFLRHKKTPPHEIYACSGNLHMAPIIRTHSF